MREPPVAIAPASHDDAEWCARVMAASEPWITLRRDLTGCRDALARPGTELFVARDDGGKPVGFVLVASPYIASIAVAADARGRGIGSALLRFTEQQFAGRGHLFLLVSSFNDRAHKVYRRHGYEPIGELRDYIVAGSSEIILHKRLA